MSGIAFVDDPNRVVYHKTLKQEFLIRDHPDLRFLLGPAEGDLAFMIATSEFANYNTHEYTLYRTLGLSSKNQLLIREPEVELLQHKDNSIKMPLSTMATMTARPSAWIRKVYQSMWDPVNTFWDTMSIYNVMMTQPLFDEFGNFHTCQALKCRGIDPFENAKKVCALKFLRCLVTYQAAIEDLLPPVGPVALVDSDRNHLFQLHDTAARKPGMTPYTSSVCGGRTVWCETAKPRGIHYISKLKDLTPEQIANRMSTSYKGGPYDGFHLDTKWCTGDDEPPLGGHNPPASKEFMDSWGTKEYMRTLMKRIEEYDSKRKPPG
ncbi:hypothetical protein CYMTET_38341 [Cymbomonas tetramitiformis]|uniref:Uncharacterized protein n=1 Tax=Cymbomonas tetramitiformis TaxID=36881 RepID=A0AAE0CC88_9CHLO|nr:hypothetical protein CYMTET_38341 [Cymbomonas tetramitiformis]